MFNVFQLGTGFKDNELEAHTTFLKQHVIKDPKSYFRYDHGLEPDEWFEPVQVWEIKCADLSISPIHKAAIGIVSYLFHCLPTIISYKTDHSFISLMKYQ